jgi:hypothetical protein
MRPIRAIAAAGIAVLAAAPWPARANPVFGSGFLAAQAPGTRHVQLTVYNEDEKANQVAFYLRDGLAWKVTWRRVGGFRTDLGSGVERVKAIQACDCSVAPGRHIFRVLVGPPTELEPDFGYRAALEVVAGKVAPAAAREPSRSDKALRSSTDGDASDVLQGIDCRSECVGVTASPPAPPPKRENPDRSRVFSGAWLFLDGRYIRPPYKLELSGLELKVNGVVVESFEPGETAKRMLYLFNRWAYDLKGGCLKHRLGTASESGMCRSPEQVAALLEKTDEIVNSKASRAEKLERLRTDPAVQGFFNIALEKVLDHWDGYR